MTSAPATKGNMEAALQRTMDELRGDHDRLRLEVRGDLEHAIHTLTWRLFGLGLAIAGITIAILRLT